MYKVSDGQAVDRSTYGNDFYIGIFRAPPWGFSDEDRIFISTLSIQSVNFTVETEIGWNYTSTVTAEEPVTVLLPFFVLRPLHANYSERYKGIHVHSDSPISVIAMVAEYDFKEGYLAYPYINLELQQYDYFVVSADTSTFSSTDSQSSFLLVGNENDTTITIAPTQIIEVPADPQDPNSALVVVGPGNTHTIKLHQMQTLYMGTAFGDLTGTAIISNKPLTVISGHECGTISDELLQQFDQTQYGWWWGPSRWCDHLVEQIPPTVTWGKRFLIVPFPDGTIQHYNKIIGSAHDTTVLQICNGSVVATITLSSPGDWNSEEWNITYDPRAYCVIESDKPILVTQFSGEGHIEIQNISTIFSQVISIVPPVEQYINIVQYFPNNDTYYGSNFVNHYVHITTTDTSSVLLDGGPHNWNWHPINDQNGNTVGYGTIHEFSDVNPHVFQHTDSSAGLSVIAYGTQYHDPSDNPQTYTFMMGMKLDALTTG